ncbi:MAG: exonuclease domain-containing protein [Lachnospiraceae bacterium]
MNYICLDLEWNQAEDVPTNESVPFEIIEIGAVKLDADFQVVDTYEALVKPKLYKKLHHHVKKMVGYTETHLKQGDSFVTACKNFLEWCGDNYRFVTWGDMDLLQLQRNMAYYHVHKLPKPLVYYNLQRIYSIEIKAYERGLSLETAVEELHLEKDMPFHRAISDAHYTARIWQLLDHSLLLPEYSYDFYQNPQNKEEEIRHTYPNRYEFISREFAEKKSIMKRNEITKINCYLCEQIQEEAGLSKEGKVSKKLAWFSGGGNNYYALAKCKKHGYIAGKIKIKQSENGHYFAHKILKRIDEEQAKQIVLRKKEIQIRRRERAKKK